MKANVLRIKKYNFSVYYQQNFAFRYTPNIMNEIENQIKKPKKDQTHWKVKMT